jgi:hypothetical protein
MKSPGKPREDGEESGHNVGLVEFSEPTRLQWVGSESSTHNKRNPAQSMNLLEENCSFVAPVSIPLSRPIDHEAEVRTNP